MNTNETLMFLGGLLNLGSWYAIYRLYRYGPYNANLVWSLLQPFLLLGGGLCTGLGIGLTAASKWWLILTIPGALIISTLLFCLVSAGLKKVYRPKSEEAED